jgi:hypothetical protein
MKRYSMEVTEATPVIRPTSSSYTQTVTRIHGTTGDKDRVVETKYEVTVYTSSGGIRTFTNSHQIDYLI